MKLMFIVLVPVFSGIFAIAQSDTQTHKKGKQNDHIIQTPNGPLQTGGYRGMSASDTSLNKYEEHIKKRKVSMKRHKRYHRKTSHTSKINETETSGKKDN